VVPLLCLSAAVSYASTRERIAPRAAADVATAARIGRALRAKETDFRRRALRKFPGDPWSQGDHVGSLERDFVRSASSREHVRPGSLLDAIDRDVRAFPGSDGERARVPACMPRPFYE
jgi:hypothetical protein